MSANHLEWLALSASLLWFGPLWSGEWSDALSPTARAGEDLVSIIPDGSAELTIMPCRRTHYHCSALNTPHPSLAGEDMEEEELNKSLQSPTLQTATCTEHGVTA